MVSRIENHKRSLQDFLAVAFGLNAFIPRKGSDLYKTMTLFAQSAASREEQIEFLQKHLKELRAENERMREALEKLARLGNGEHYGNSIGNDIAIAALRQKG